MANPLDCFGQPLPWSDRPCAPGDVDTPICYSVPPATEILPGVKRITINADCTASGSVILDQALAPVPGAVEVGCESGCGFPCDAVGLCAALSALPVQVPAPADTAVYAGPGGCFLGVPIAGAVAFPLLAPNGSCAAPSYSFTASPDSGLFYDPAGVGSVVLGDDSCLDSITVGASIRIQTASVTRLIFTNTGEWDVGGSVGAVGEVLTSNGVGVPPTWQAAGGLTFPILAPNGSCAAPSYSFTASPDSGMFFTGTGVRVANDNCDSYIEIDSIVTIEASNGDTFQVGASITGNSALGNVAWTAGNNFTATAGAAITLIASTGATLTGSGANINATVGPVALFATTSLAVSTGATLRLTIGTAGGWNIGGSEGAAGEVLTSAGAGAPPVWMANAVGGSGNLVWATNNISSGADTRVVPVGYDNAAINTQTPKGFMAPRAGTFRNLFARHNTANGNGASVDYTLRINGVVTALTTSLATGAIGSSSDLVNSVAVAQGDLIEMICTKAVSIGSGVLEVFISAEFA